MVEPGDESSSLGTFFQPVLGLAVVQVSPGCPLGRAGTRVRVTGTASGAGIALPGAALVRASLSLQRADVERTLTNAYCSPRSSLAY